MREIVRRQGRTDVSIPGETGDKETRPGIPACRPGGVPTENPTRTLEEKGEKRGNKFAGQAPRSQGARSQPVNPRTLANKQPIREGWELCHVQHDVEVLDRILETANEINPWIQFTSVCAEPGV